MKAVTNPKPSKHLGQMLTFTLLDETLVFLLYLISVYIVSKEGGFSICSVLQKV